MTQQFSEPAIAYNHIHDKALSQFFINAGSGYEEEKLLLGVAIKEIMEADGHLSNKRIILWLITALETSKDVVQNDVIRHALEIVVGYTEDDI
ncbi:two-component-system connector protein AriR [Salmonella enterica subsp. enterica serovar Choleraesuis]|nr:two-component-system connector protein AriR [Salmonella enterica subsp. enterica serovar Choleraesuis]